MAAAASTSATVPRDVYEMMKTMYEERIDEMRSMFEVRMNLVRREASFAFHETETRVASAEARSTKPAELLVKENTKLREENAQLLEENAKLKEQASAADAALAQLTQFVDNPPTRAAADLEPRVSMKKKADAKADLASWDEF